MLGALLTVGASQAVLQSKFDTTRGGKMEPRLGSLARKGCASGRVKGAKEGATAVEHPSHANDEDALRSAAAGTGMKLGSVGAAAVVNRGLVAGNDGGWSLVYSAARRSSSSQFSSATPRAYKRSTLRHFSLYAGQRHNNPLLLQGCC